mmetsp:Transcript_150105/g.260038  ORF Transcript_150105/g.260038 Transcript_150105/m.260038 type:complete len:300 (+) Transcript_150105:80-979(+)
MSPNASGGDDRMNRLSFSGRLSRRKQPALVTGPEQQPLLHWQKAAALPALARSPKTRAWLQWHRAAAPPSLQGGPLEDLALPVAPAAAAADRRSAAAAAAALAAAAGAAAAKAVAATRTELRTLGEEAHSTPPRPVPPQSSQSSRTGTSQLAALQRSQRLEALQVVERTLAVALHRLLDCWQLVEHTLAAALHTQPAVALLVPGSACTQQQGHQARSWPSQTCQAWELSLPLSSGMESWMQLPVPTAVTARSRERSPEHSWTPSHRLHRQVRTQPVPLQAAPAGPHISRQPLLLNYDSS